MSSPIVGDVAYETLVKLSRCIAPPLNKWALDIATALRLTRIEESNVILDLISAVDSGESNDKRCPGLLHRVVNALSISCKTGQLPVDTFIFVFPVGYQFLQMRSQEAH